MKSTKIVLGFVLSLIFFGFVADRPAYRLYSKEGKTVEYKKMLEELKTADIVFFGEEHNNPISHWLEYEITNDLITLREQKVVLGAEMFESDNQLIINEFLSGIIQEKKFEAECRLWPNYSTDYKPLLKLAEKNKIPFIATNIPRRYASVVYKKGFEGLDSLSVEAKRYIAPLPIKYDPEQDAYKSMMGMGGMPAHLTVNLPKAQAIKDATMAHFINENIKKGYTFMHYEGAYHSDKYQGIIYYLNQYHPNLKIVTITTISSDNLETLSEEDRAKADYIILVDENMTTTY